MVKSMEISYYNYKFCLDKYNNLNIAQDTSQISFMLSSMLDYVSPTDVALDVGAFIGYTAIALANKCRKVLAFEPAETAFNILKTNTAPYENISIFNVAVGRYNQLVDLYIEPTFEADNRVLPVTGRATQPVKMVTLDAAVQEEVNFIKVDVQGYEGEVIRGAINLVNTYKPTLCLEFAPYLQDQASVTSAQLLDVLDFLGYTFIDIDQLNYELIPTSKSYLLNRYRKELGIHTDILCIHRNNIG